MSVIWIRHVEIVNETGQERGDLLLRDGQIERMGASLGLDGTADMVIDGEGLTAMPGLVDLHVHLRDFEQSYKDTVEYGRTRGGGRRGNLACTDCP